ncbi:hypothetical protein ACJW30_01G077300 [Castanea mollissima]
MGYCEFKRFISAGSYTSCHQNFEPFSLHYLTTKRTRENIEMVYITESILNANFLLVEIQYPNLTIMIDFSLLKKKKKTFNHSCWVARENKPPHNSTSTKNIRFSQKHFLN